MKFNLNKLNVKGEIDIEKWIKKTQKNQLELTYQTRDASYKMG